MPGARQTRAMTAANIGLGWPKTFCAITHARSAASVPAATSRQASNHRPYTARPSFLMAPGSKRRDLCTPANRGRAQCRASRSIVPNHPGRPAEPLEQYQRGTNACNVQKPLLTRHSALRDHDPPCPVARGWPMRIQACDVCRLPVLFARRACMINDKSGAPGPSQRE